MAIGDETEQPAAQRPHQEGCRKQHGSVELLHHWIAVWEECRREVKRERRIGVEIIPFDEIADRADEDRLHTALDVVTVEMLATRIDRLIAHNRPPAGGLLSLWVKFRPAFRIASGAAAVHARCLLTRSLCRQDRA